MIAHICQIMKHSKLINFELSLSQLVPVEMRSSFCHKEDRRQHREASSEKISVIESAEGLRDTSPYHQSDTDTDIPAGEVSRCGRSPLAIGSKIDKQSVESRKHRAESDSLRQGDPNKQIGSEDRIPFHQSLE